MATRIPLIVNTAANQIQELPTGDSLTGISTLTATKFIGEISNIGISSIGISTIGFASITQLVVTGVSTFGSGLVVNSGGINVTGIITATTFNGSLATSNLSGTITNDQLAGSIANSKLTNSSVSFGGVSVSLGSADATPAFNLTDATNYPVSSLSGAGTGVLTFLATPSSANLASAVTDDTGSGALVFATSPTLVTPSLGDATATGINVTGASGIITTTNINATGIITSTNGFTSGAGEKGVQITVSGTAITFTVAGVGSTTLNLY